MLKDLGIKGSVDSFGENSGKIMEGILVANANDAKQIAVNDNESQEVKKFLPKLKIMNFKKNPENTQNNRTLLENFPQNSRKQTRN